MVKILVAEDEAGQRMAICSILGKLGHVTIQASNGQVAQAILEDNLDIGMVVTDVAMPQVDGRQLISFVRQHPVLHDTPILVISGVIGPNEIDGLLRLGASRFLPKPIDAAPLREYAEKLLRQN